ncbi:MAG: hypothetical protein Barrevirus12_9 [Barrevirus sp.]|uniref:Uncharacterized protein n=1 Tax=Barrevirus sp. TaxID=2487763 RepID=A0A3G4ZQC5_9VIRU|nr:MAG: hypothetical protein Barrevirus12_9 [Barrevirus sp.]
MEYIKWILDNCCCFSNYTLKRKRKKILTEEQIREEALKMLQKWRIEKYENNPFSCRIKIDEEKKQLDLFIKDLRINNLFL